MEKPPRTPLSEPKDQERLGRLIASAEHWKEVYKSQDDAVGAALDNAGIMDAEGRRKWFARLKPILAAREKRRDDVIRRDAVKNRRNYEPGESHD